ncbi:MAG: DNA adenine methylase [Alphaproteobacteria bacterium]|nr:DNA adenine methylase [Alphaproteobacteria bacterium]MBU1823773.1 DNA adenine methylase [Alphaproteobacteria bacterium]
MPKSSAVKAQNDQTETLDVETPGFVFRPIHYLGSKLRVLPSIGQAIDRVDPSGGPVCDLFSGSATVSRYLSRSRRVLAVDIQEYARVLADAVLNGAPAYMAKNFDASVVQAGHSEALRQAVAPLVSVEDEFATRALRGDIEPLCELLDLGNLASLENAPLPVSSGLSGAVRETLRRIEALGLRGEETVCIRHFGGQYFSYAQAAELDALAAMAHKTRSSVALAATLSTASQLVNSIGKQFAQPIRPRDKFGAPKRHVVKKIVSERALSARSIFMRYLWHYEGLATTRRDHVAMRADFREALANPAIRPSVVYADPPYTRDHYSRFYHSLETIALGDEPSITKSNLGGGGVKSRGGYRAGRHQSPFCIKSEAPRAFSSLFAGVADLGVPLVLSYSGFDPSMEARPRVMALDAVIGLAERYFREVQVEQLTDLDHIKLNSSSMNKAAKGTTEVLLLCR